MVALRKYSLGRSSDILKNQIKPETQDIPVVAISANAMPRDVKQGLAAGFCDYLTKPLDVAEFHRVVAEILQAERAQ